MPIESTTFSITRTRNEYDLATISKQQLIDQNEKIIIPESSLNNDSRHLKLNAIRQALRNVLEIASEEQKQSVPSNPFKNSMADDKNLRSVENNLTEVNRHSESNKNAPNKISRIVRDREHIFNRILDRISKNLYADEENVTSLESVSESKQDEAEGGKNLHFAENATTKLFTHENNRVASNNNNILRRGRGNSRMKFSHNSGAVTAVAMVSIGAIMLLVGPIVIILRVLDERRQVRKLRALSAAVREDLPPSYEEAVFLNEAPRYSTLALNDDDSEPPPSSTLMSPIFSANHVTNCKSHST